MSQPTTAVIDEVPIEIYDLTDAPAPHQKGFYYSIPCDEDEKIHPSEVRLAGPYPTHDAALQAAKDFIADALSDLQKISSPSIVPDQS